MVVTTVVLHGFSLNPLARLLKLGSGGPQGVLIVGASAWTTALAEQLTAMELPTTIVDRNWSHLRDARLQGIDVFYGEILSELAEHHLEINRFGYLIAGTDDNSYNALVCTDFGPEFGRNNVFQIGRLDSGDSIHNLAVTLGGRPLLKDVGDYAALNARLAEGWTFRKTTLSDDFNEATLRAEIGQQGGLLLARRADRLVWLTSAEPPKLLPDDVVLSFGPARD
jgi:hypothetical protein